MKKVKTPAYHPVMTAGKREIIRGLLSEYKIETAQDIQDALKDLMGTTIKEMMEAEMNEHLGYKKSERSSSDNARNGCKKKTVKSSMGKLELEVPQDRKSTFQPKIVEKRQKDISAIDGKIISMYARGATTRQISDTIQEIYGFDVSEGFISDVTDKILPEIAEWQERPLSECYPIVLIDAIHYSVKDSGVVKKLAAYVILGITHEGHKEILSLSIGENESAKYWLSELNALKARGVKDIFIVCSDGLTGIKEAIEAAFPHTEHQRCIAHLIRNTLKYVSYKDYKALTADLKTIYLAANEEIAAKNLEIVAKKWEAIYPRIMSVWRNNWASICPIFKFSKLVRRAFYTTNAIESLNASLRKLNRQRNIFPNRTALLKGLYLAMLEITKKWTTTIANWGQIRAELSVMYEGRLPE